MGYSIHFLINFLFSSFLLMENDILSVLIPLVALLFSFVSAPPMTNRPGKRHKPPINSRIHSWAVNMLLNLVADFNRDYMMTHIIQAGFWLGLDKCCLGQVLSSFFFRKMKKEDGESSIIVSHLGSQAKQKKRQPGILETMIKRFTEISDKE